MLTLKKNYSWSCQGFHDEHYGCSLVMEDTAWSVKVRNFQELQIIRWMMWCEPELYDPSLSLSWSPAIQILPFPLEAICGETLISCSISAPRKCSSGWVSSTDHLRKQEDVVSSLKMEILRFQRALGFRGQSVVNSPWWIYGISSVLEQISWVWSYLRRECRWPHSLCSSPSSVSLAPPQPTPYHYSILHRPYSGLIPQWGLELGSLTPTLCFSEQSGYSFWRTKCHFFCLPPASFPSPTLA